MKNVQRVFTDDAPAPLGHYSQAVRSAGLIHVSAQLPIKGGEYPSESDRQPFADQARLVLSNVLRVLHAAGAQPIDVLKVTAYIVGVENWGVFNTAFAEAFGDARPARSVVPVPHLHHGYLVALDAVALDVETTS
jgi:2-iminobutanoate/2-iminopropanoate deaminase|nr:RidA family protein [uncultured Acidovorax sp.]